MIRVFYNASGVITATIENVGANSFPATSLPYIDLESVPNEIGEWIVQDGELVANPDLIEIRRPDALETVRKVSGEIRRMFVTDLPGQEMLYVRKEAEARDFLLNPLSSHPLIEAEIGISGASKADVATLYITLAGQWQQVAAALETIRLSAGAAIEAATTVAEIEGILGSFNNNIAALKVSLG